MDKPENIVCPHVSLDQGFLDKYVYFYRKMKEGIQPFFSARKKKLYVVTTAPQKAIFFNQKVLGPSCSKHH